MSLAKNTVEVLPRVLGDRMPIPGTLTDNAGNAVDLTGKTILFRLVNCADNTVKVNNAAADVITAVQGKVSYTPAAIDVDTLGDYAIYFIDDQSVVDPRYPYDGPNYILRIINEGSGSQA